MTLPTNQLRCLAVTWPCPNQSCKVPCCPMTLFKPKSNGALLTLSLNCNFIVYSSGRPHAIIVTSVVYSLWRYLFVLPWFSHCPTFGFTLLPSLSESHKCAAPAGLLNRHSPFTYCVPKGLLFLSAPEVFYRLWGPWFTHCAVPGIYEAQARLSDWYIGLTHPATRSHRSSESPTNICKIHVQYMHTLSRVKLKCLRWMLEC